MSSLDNTFTFLQGHADEALGLAQSTVNRMAFLEDITSEDVEFEFDVEKPTLDRPAELADFMPDNIDESTYQYLDTKADEWLDKYFPELQSCLKHQPEQWLCGIITGQNPFGLSREVFDTVWLEGRDRAYQAANTEGETLMASFAARGFSMPPGALFALQQQSEIRASGAIADINRTQTVRDAEIKLDLMKFAVSQAVQLKAGILSALGNFYRIWMQIPNTALEAARMKVSAYATLQSALSSYHNIEMGFERLRLAAAETEANVELRNQARFGDLISAYNGRNSSLASAARAFGDISAAAAGSAGSIQAEISSGSLT